MLNYFVRRVLGVIPTLLIMAVLMSLSVHLLLGDPARLAADPEADEAMIDLVRRNLGLGKPMHEQFVRFLVNAARGEFGNSTRIKHPMNGEISEHFWPMLNLAITSMAWAAVFDMVIGITSAVWRSRWPDRLSVALVVSGISSPTFALGILLMEVFSVQLGWLPSIRAGSWKHYILPLLTLGAIVAATMARFTRTSLVGVLQEDFVCTAHARGVREMVVVTRHCLRDTMISVITMMGLQFGFLLDGPIVVEKVFN